MTTRKTNSQINAAATSTSTTKAEKKAAALASLSSKKTSKKAKENPMNVFETHLISNPTNNETPFYAVFANKENRSEEHTSELQSQR